VKIVASRCRILRLKFTKFDFGWGSAQDLAGGAYSAPSDPYLDLRGHNFRGREGRERGNERGLREGTQSGINLPPPFLERICAPGWLMYGTAVHVGGPVTGTAREIMLPKVNDSECAQFWGIEATMRLCAGRSSSAGLGICSVSTNHCITCSLVASLHRRRLFILSTEAQLQRLYQSNVNYRSENVFTSVKHYREYTL